MKSKQVLSIEQMRYLHKLGLDTSDASMVLIATDDDSCSLDWETALTAISMHLYEVSFELFDADSSHYNHSYREDCGVFTLQDILDKLPPSVNWNPLIIVGNSVMYSAGYGEGYDHPIKIFKEESLLESAYKMLCWIIEQNKTSSVTSV